jgi:hypothetical protein
MSDPRHTCFTLCINENDKATRDYVSGYDFKGFENEVIIENLPKTNLAKYYNMIYDQTKTKTEPGTVVSQVGDDMVFRTKGWDERMLALINTYKGIGVFWCNDDFIAKERCPVNLFVTRQFIEATGKPFMCEEFPADMIDYIWGKIGKYTRTSHYLSDVHIFHNHSSNKPLGKRDLTHRRLMVLQEEAHRIGGKPRAKAVAHEITEILIKKGLVGTSIC